MEDQDGKMIEAKLNGQKQNPNNSDNKQQSKRRQSMIRVDLNASQSMFLDEVNEEEDLDFVAEKHEEYDMVKKLSGMSNLHAYQEAMEFQIPLGALYDI